MTVARGAIGNPWIFAQVRALAAGEPLPDPPTLHEQRDVITRALPAGRGTVRPRALPARHAEVRDQVLAAPSAAQAKCGPISARVKQPGAWRDVLDKWYAVDGPGVHPPIEEPNPACLSDASLAGSASALPDARPLEPAFADAGLRGFFVRAPSPVAAFCCVGRLGGDRRLHGRRVRGQEPRPIALEQTHAIRQLGRLPARCRPRESVSPTPASPARECS